jgi:hypothetical protein
VTEPESAAIYTLKWMSEGANKEDIHVGDNFVLCDAGGINHASPILSCANHVQAGLLTLSPTRL